LSRIGRDAHAETRTTLRTTRCPKDCSARVSDPAVGATVGRRAWVIAIAQVWRPSVLPLSRSGDLDTTLALADILFLRASKGSGHPRSQPRFSRMSPRKSILLDVFPRAASHGAIMRAVNRRRASSPTEFDLGDRDVKVRSIPSLPLGNDLPGLRRGIAEDGGCRRNQPCGHRPPPKAWTQTRLPELPCLLCPPHNDRDPVHVEA